MKTTTFETREGRPLLLLALSTCALLLQACGGGGGSSGGGVTPPPVGVTTVTYTGRAADGPLQGATACFDLNDNGDCDSGEPTAGPTDANGSFSLVVAAADAGKHRIVVQVPATAIDKDTGAAVGTAFSLMAPASGAAGDQAVFVSPLTTAVQFHIDRTAASLVAAGDFIKAQAGLAASPLADFTQAATPANKHAGLVARLIILTSRQHLAVLTPVVGTQDISGATITTSDVEKAVIASMIENLPAMAAAASDPAVSGATVPTDLTTALTSAANTIVTNRTSVTAANAAVLIGAGKLPPVKSSDVAATGNLAILRFSNNNDWYFRANLASAADNTPDANSMQRFYLQRSLRRVTAFGSAVTVGWGYGTNDPDTQDNPHWNGSAWVTCPLGQRSTTTQRDAQGRSTYDYCDKASVGVSTRVELDVSGKPIADVVSQTLRKFPGGLDGVSFANWGPADLALLGTAKFPTGSKVYIQNEDPQQIAASYDAQPINNVSAYPPAVSAGGDSRTTAGLACAGNLTGLYTNVANLEDMVARYPGKPCVFSKNVTDPANPSLDPNEWWGNSTINFGDVPDGVTRPAGTGTHYSTMLGLRASFAPTGNAVTYYSCYRRTAGSGARNCTVIGTGSYSIQALGDARVMSFSNQPGAFQLLGYERVFVERGGAVHYGTLPIPKKTTQPRLNLEAMNAVFTQLGLRPVTPMPPASAADATKQQTFATLKGAWGGVSATGATVLRFGDGGAVLQGEAGPAGAGGSSGAELGVLDINADGTLNSLLNADSNGQWGVSDPGATERVTSVTPTQIVTTTSTVNRLPNDNTSLVGLWAVGSPTSLKTEHVAFFANGQVMMIDPVGEPTSGINACALADQGPPGVELASYTFNPATGALRVFNKVYDSNGCAGFFDSSTGGVPNTEANEVLQLAADGKSLTVLSSGMVVYRVSQ